jgi:TRAP-type C4-dicarboxylate transport system permease small subunit
MMFRVFDRLTGVLATAALVTSVALFVVMVLLNGAEGVGRYVFQASSIYLVETSLVLGTAVYFVGYVVLLQKDEDIRMGYFVERLPRRVGQAIDVFTELGVVVFFLVLVKATWSYFQLTSLMPHSLFPFSQGWVVLPLLTGAVAGLWVAVHRLVAAILRMRSRDNHPG